MIQKIFLIAIVIVIIKYVWSMDTRDRSNPFGLSKKCDSKLISEENGPTLFKGKPKKSDSILKRLQKIDWLIDNSSRDVLWRRTLAFSMAISIIILYSLNLELNLQKYLTTTVFIFLVIYLSHSYYEHHINHYRCKYIKEHVKRMQNELNESNINIS